MSAIERIQESIALRVAEVHWCALGTAPTLDAWEILARLWKPLVGADSDVAPGLTEWQDGRPCVCCVDAVGAVSVTLVLAPAVDTAREMATRLPGPDGVLD